VAAEIFFVRLIVSTAKHLTTKRALKTSATQRPQRPSVAFLALSA
jgi:hypothetical protein